MTGEGNIFCEIMEEYEGRKNILIVDDDVEMLNIFRFYLRDIYNVSVISSGSAALELMKNYTPDLVLLDYMMPDCNGAEVYKEMKQNDRLKGVPVIFLTGVTDEETIKECMSYKPAGYIVKPIAKPALLAKLEGFFR